VGFGVGGDGRTPSRETPEYNYALFRGRFCDVGGESGWRANSDMIAAARERRRMRDPRNCSRAGIILARGGLFAPAVTGRAVATCADRLAFGSPDRLAAPGSPERLAAPGSPERLAARGGLRRPVAQGRPVRSGAG
jgi:hypothetical protein